eukprot:GILI01012466.1.p1 GENE.GILI01012466.1~~GILI01012466.1.p1  ORF type:complete len:188 (-),score=13.63 GILI01012466.1:68-607(-)
MTFEGTITKALLVITPAFNTTEHAAEVRHSLYEGGFIVIREEHRIITNEVAHKIAGVDGPVATHMITGSCLIFVVARTNAAETLNAFRSSHPRPGALYSCTKSVEAQRAVQFLFPKMIVDPIPSNPEARDFIQSELKSVIIDGLTEIAKQKPENSIEFFARYLLDHNPNSPPISIQTRQ